MLRLARHHDVVAIQTILNAPENLSKLQGYSDEKIRVAIDDTQMAIFIWEEDDQ